ncbi:MAG: DUF2779 domain-containing protein [Gammaproteobacteria bacterium]|nr:DUF2779 domain-containing protein [Gammaproteobacteria bacterium]
MNRFLTKTNFQTGRLCLKRLWNEFNGNWVRKLSANDEKNSIEGERFNLAVRDYFEGGVFIGWTDGSAEQAARKTQELLNQDQIVLFEAAFIHENLLCFADVVIKNKSELTLIEAKSSNKPKVTSKDNFDHIYDAAFQNYVMSQSGFKPTSIQLLHANGDCVWPDKKNLFCFKDISEEVFKRQNEIEVAIENQLSVLDYDSSPRVSKGLFCKKPSDKACPHIEQCWDKPTKETIYDLPRINEDKINLLEHNDVHLIKDIPTSVQLTKGQNRIVETIKNRKEEYDLSCVKDKLSHLNYPIHFFDFETYNASVPIWNNCRPWQQVPFQYSLHIVESNGDISHFEYLSSDLQDPRIPLIEAMQQHFKPTGSIVVYYQPFEKSRIEELARDFPDYSDFLESLNVRLWDQYEVFKQCFTDYRLALSQSIKVVLPTFVPELSYQNIKVQKGDQAQLAWRKMIEMSDGRVKDKKINELKDYCKLDTLAMLKLHEFLIKRLSM